ncbi:hypothetical protein BC829DRAFT_428782 [Chytridium lagenaria]|nr:hypothetical protein BC829DRAFT_428782 [Chytridium lagenaria]
MAKKAKKAGGKGGGKGKGKGKSKKSKKTSNPLPPEQANALLTYLFVEAKEKSVNFYRKWYKQQKDFLAKHRDALHKLEKSEYGFMRNLLDGTEILSTQIETMAISHDDQVKSNTADAPPPKDSALMSQRSELEDLRDLVDKLETELENCTDQISDLHKFQASGGPQLQEMEMQRIREVAHQKAESRAQEINRIQTKHEASVLATARRADQVISEIETKANKQGIERMTVTRMKIVKRNRKLKDLVQVLSSDAEKLKRAVEILETENIRLMRNLYSLDYNLRYGRPPSANGMRSAERGYKWDEEDELEVVLPMPLRSISEAMPRILRDEDSKRQEQMKVLGVEGHRWHPKGHKGGATQQTAIT